MSYRITIEPDTNGWWFVDAPDVPGAHSQGQTLSRARANIKEAIALILDLPEGAETTMEVEERLILPDVVQTSIEAARCAREEAERTAEAARQATEDALAITEKYLPELGLRDRGELLGVSFQRVAQLRPGAPRRGRRPEPRRH